MSSRSADASPSVAVVEAVAERMGADPTSLQPPLDNVVDTDALDSIFADRSDGQSRSVGHVSFQYKGYAVTVHSGGVVMVEEEDDAVAVEL